MTSPAAQIAILRNYKPKPSRQGPPCCTGGCTVLSCIRIIQELELNPAIATSKINFTKCRFDKGHRETVCPPGGRA